jgi:hypothetical protein
MKRVSEAAIAVWLAFQVPIASAQQAVAVGVEFQVNTYTTGGQGDASVSMNEPGNFIVVWQSSDSAGTDHDNDSIQAQRFLSDGSLAGSQFQVNTYTTSPQRDPSVALDADGGFIVAWHSSLSAGTDSYSSIQAQRFGSDGNPVGSQFQVNTYTTSTQGGVSMGMDEDGDFVVSWTSWGSAGTDVGTYDGSIQARRYLDAFIYDGFESGDTARWSVTVP